MTRCRLNAQRTIQTLQLMQEANKGQGRIKSENFETFECSIHALSHTVKDVAHNAADHICFAGKGRSSDANKIDAVLSVHQVHDEA